MIYESYWVLKILGWIFNQPTFLFSCNHAFCKSIFRNRLFIWFSTLTFKPTLAENGKSLPTLCPVLTSVFKNSCNHTVIKPSKQTKSGLYFERLISVKNLWPNFSKIVFVIAVFGHLCIFFLWFSISWYRTIISSVSKTNVCTILFYQGLYEY